MLDYNPYQIFKDYIFLKQHFKQWDFFWGENSSYKVSVESFKNRKDLHFFKKLYKEYNTRNDCIQHLISGLLFNKDIWIGGLFDEDVVSYHYSRMKTFNQIDLVFVQDCEKIEDFLKKQDVNSENAFLTKGTKDCIVLEVKNISLETLTLFHHFNQWALYWFPLHPLKKERRFQIYKYQSQLQINSRSYDNIKDCYTKLMQS